VTPAASFVRMSWDSYTTDPRLFVTR